MDTALPHLEIPLFGGRYTANVMRVGDTVRKPALPTSPFVARLLQHLEHVGFKAAPRYLGRDDKGRDSFTYIDGIVTEHWRHYTDNAVRQAGAWLRAFHDATRSASFLEGHSVVCHNDPAPNNAVFQGERIAAFIDFDMAAPGHPLEDLGYMAWSWCVSSNPARPSVPDQAAQVRLLVDAYGLDDVNRAGVVAAMMERQTRNVRFWHNRRDEPPNPTLIPVSNARIDEIIKWSERERAFIETYQGAFLTALI